MPSFSVVRQFLQPGKRADLVLLAPNPLDDIRNTTGIQGVMMGGRWFKPPELAQTICQSSFPIGGIAPDSIRSLRSGS